MLYWLVRRFLRHCMSHLKAMQKFDILYKIKSQFPSRSHRRTAVHSLPVHRQTRLPELLIEFQMPHVSETRCLTTACNLPSFELIPGEGSYNFKNSVHWSYSAAVSCDPRRNGGRYSLRLRWKVAQGFLIHLNVPSNKNLGKVKVIV